MKSIAMTAVTAALLTCAACASAKVDTKSLKAATDEVKAANVAALECPDLAEKRDELLSTTAGAVVKPKTVDLTSPTGIAKAKDLSVPGTAASVALTTVKSTIPGAGFLPLITGSARREAKRSEAIADARVTLARLEGAMLVKECPFDGEAETAPAEDASLVSASAEEPAAAAPAEAPAPLAEPRGEPAPAIIEK